MQLPEKTFLMQNFTLAESDFECNGQAKPLRIMQLLQDIATNHAQMLGLGWHTMDSNNMLWVLGKIKITFHCKLNRQNACFKLYTWPLAPTRFYAERCFAACDDNGRLLFSATSLWLIIDRTTRTALPATAMNNFYKGEYSAVHCDTANRFERVRPDESFVLSYTTTVRRSHLDQNGHVNNTNYITYALDVLSPSEQIAGAEVVYHKELHLGDELQVYCKKCNQNVQVVGQHNGETCFTALLQL